MMELIATEAEQDGVKGRKRYLIDRGVLKMELSFVKKGSASVGIIKALGRVC